VNIPECCEDSVKSIYIYRRIDSIYQKYGKLPGRFRDQVVLDHQINYPTNELV
jgi:hypothetical protein